MATHIPETGEVKDIVDNAKDGLRQAFEKGSERAMHFKDAAFDRGRSAMSAIERTVEERPFTVLGGVFVGGLILGMLLRRS